MTPKNLNGWDAARMYALLNLAMADGYIVYAQVGNTFNFWRPVTAIHYYDPASTWQEFGFPTPPTREYASGHAMVAAAAATVLKDVLASDAASFSATSTSLPNVTRSYTSFSAAASECAVSRIYIGYHFRKSTTDGLGARRRDRRLHGERHARPVALSVVKRTAGRRSPVAWS